jgi:Xaa-Pro dipeptidase
MDTDYRALRQLFLHWLENPGHPLELDLTQDEYRTRVARARAEMSAHSLDALVVTSSAIGQWFTGRFEPHEWHDQCQARSTWYIVTPESDCLCMPPTTGGEHLNTTRRSTWVSEITAIAEVAEPPRTELWALEQMPEIFADLGVARGRLGFELGDCMTLGITTNDFLRLRELMPDAQLVDASPALRRLMSIHTEEEIRRLRRACEAADWVHREVPKVLRAGITERELAQGMAQRFSTHFGPEYAYDAMGHWDVRNVAGRDSITYHTRLADRVYRAGDLVARGYSGASYLGYGADIDRTWFVGVPPKAIADWYHTAWECSQAMIEVVAPGRTCAEIYEACISIERQHGRPKRQVGRVGHGLRNTGGLSVFPSNQTVLEPNMVISVEPMTNTEYGWITVEEQLLVTATGAEILNARAPEQLLCLT